MPEKKLAFQKPGPGAATTDLPSDPSKPMSIPGRSFPGAKDARAFESQSDVRTWTTDPLEQPLEINGAISASIWIQAETADTDLILRVSDVYPDGRSILLMDYPMRARYRNGFETESFLIPGEPAELRWRIGWTSIILNRGHRLRVTLSTTGFPLYEPNPQTGAAQTAAWMRHTQRATHRILHDAAHPSHITLPLP